MTANEQTIDETTEPETYSDSVRELIRLNDKQLNRLLREHGFTFNEYATDTNAQPINEMWSADDVLAWLGY